MSTDWQFVGCLRFFEFRFDGESRQYALETITRDGQPHLVLVVNGSSGSSSSAGGGQASGQFKRPTGETIAWQCNEIKGNPLANIAGRQYDLTRGGLFLVDARTDPISVEQVAFDPQVIQASQTRAGLEQMAQTDPKLHTFLQACWGAGPAKTAEATPMQPDE